MVRNDYLAARCVFQELVANIHRRLVKEPYVLCTESYLQMWQDHVSVYFVVFRVFPIHFSFSLTLRGSFL